MRMRTMLMSALVLALVAPAMASAQVGTTGGLYLPPAGTDLMPATKAELVVDAGNGPQEVRCSGPTKVARGEPAGSFFDTEMLQLDLACADGIRVGLNPNMPSRGQTNAAGDSFFDVFVEVSVPGMGVLHNHDPIRMQARIGHVPPLGSKYFSAGPVTLTGTGATARLLSVTHAINGVPKPESSGEYSAVMACFYECRLDSPGKNWLETTVLMLTNQSAKQGVNANLLFLNGNEQPIARAVTYLSPLDLDAVHVCATLDKAGIPVPPAGLVEVATTIPGTIVPLGGAYGWVKDFVGKQPRAETEIIASKVTGIGKTQCRLVGPNTVRPQEILEITAPVVNPILVDRTAD